MSADNTSTQTLCEKEANRTGLKRIAAAEVAQNPQISAN